MLTITRDEERLCERAIRLLEAKIQKDFGLSIKMGAELEYRFTDKEIKPKQYAGVDSGNKGSHRKPGLMPEDAGLNLRPSRYIATHYEDGGIGKNEVVFSHEPQDNHGCAILARVLQRSKEMLIREAEKRDTIAHFPAIMKGDQPVSMQLNISLWRDEKNVLADAMNGPKVCKADVLAACMLPYMKDTSLLMLPSENSMARIHYKNKRFESAGRIDQNSINDMRQHQILVVRCDNSNIKDSTRIETRLAGSDANPHLAIIAALHSVYHGLRDLVSNKKNVLKDLALYKSTNVDLGEIPKKHSNIIDAFQGEQHLAQMLNALDDQDHNLGSRIKGMALKYTQHEHQYRTTESVGRR